MLGAHAAHLEDLLLHFGRAERLGLGLVLGECDAARKGDDGNAGKQGGNVLGLHRASPGQDANGPRTLASRPARQL